MFSIGFASLASSDKPPLYIVRYGEILFLDSHSTSIARSNIISFCYRHSKFGWQISTKLTTIKENKFKRRDLKNKVITEMPSRVNLTFKKLPQNWVLVEFLENCNPP